MLQAYRQHVAERAALGIPPLPRDAKQVADLIEIIKAPGAEDGAYLMDVLAHRVPPGVTTDDIMRELRGRAPGDPVEP